MRGFEHLSRTDAEELAAPHEPAAPLAGLTHSRSTLVLSRRGPLVQRCVRLLTGYFNENLADSDPGIPTAQVEEALWRFITAHVEAVLHDPDAWIVGPLGEPTVFEGHLHDVQREQQPAVDEAALLAEWEAAQGPRYPQAGEQVLGSEVAA